MLRLIVSLSIAALMCGTSAANQDRLPERVPEARSSSQAQDVAADFGTDFFFTAVDGSQFDPRLNTTPYERGSSTGTYYCATGGTQSVARGQIFLPHGVLFSSSRAWIWDDLNTHSVTVTLQSVCQPDFAAGAPVVTDLDTVNSGVAFNAGNVTVFGLGAVGAIADNESCVYRYEVSFPEGCAGAIALGVQKARLSWQRFIPVAPAVASFTDVPTNAQFFREIEALANSGITAGCTATTFCPDQTVTRRQMAAFLARALGLPDRSFPDPGNP